MLKDNFRFKLKIKAPIKQYTPSYKNKKKNAFFDLNSCPVQNNKLNFNYIFWKENKINPNQKAIQFNSHLLNEQQNHDKMNNITQSNINIELKKIKVSNHEENNKRENIPKTEGKIRKIKPIFAHKSKINCIKKVNPNKIGNILDNNSKSNNLLPLVQRDSKLYNKSKSKPLFHNKSGINIKINIDCSIRNKCEEYNPNNNIIIKKIDKKNTNEIDEMNAKNVNDIPKKNDTVKKAFIEYFYKEEPNLEHNKTMEDFVLIKESFLNTAKYKLSLFALFDGHGGGHVAQYLKKNFCDVLKRIIFINENLDLVEILKITIETIDKEIAKLNNVKECGSTGTVVLIDNNNDAIYCVNVGDSKCYYINDKEAIQITEDHNCKNKAEVENVKKKGVKVFNGRVFGCLLLTRTFGDTDYKEVGINCEPYIKKLMINENRIKFIVLASDGIWDVIDEHQLYIIKYDLKNGSTKEFCNNLVEFSLHNGSNDNISCIVLKFAE